MIFYLLFIYHLLFFIYHLSFINCLCSVMRTGGALELLNVLLSGAATSRNLNLLHRIRDLAAAWSATLPGPDSTINMCPKLDFIKTDFKRRIEPFNLYLIMCFYAQLSILMRNFEFFFWKSLLIFALILLSNV